MFCQNNIFDKSSIIVLYPKCPHNPATFNLTKTLALLDICKMDGMEPNWRGQIGRGNRKGEIDQLSIQLNSTQLSEE